MKLTFEGKADELKKLLDAISGSKEQSLQIDDLRTQLTSLRSKLANR